MSRKASRLTMQVAVVSGALLLGAGISGCGRTESAASLVSDAQAYQAKGDLKAALIQMKNAVNQSPEDAAVRLHLAKLYNDSGDPVSAEKEFRKAASLGATSAQVLPGLAMALQASGQHQKVITETEQAAAAAGADAGLLVTRGNSLLATGQAPAAKAAFDAALASRPNHGGALLGLASYAFSQNDTAGGNQLAESAAAKDPKNPDVWMYKAMLAGRSGKPDAAIVAYDQVLMLDPAHRTAHIEKAHSQISLGKFDAAKASLDAAKKNAAGNLLISYTQALLDHTQGKHEVALESVQKVLRSVPEHMPSILLAGAIQLSLGQLEQAEQNLKKYLGTYPNTLYARKLLASAQLRASHPGDATATLAPALQQANPDPQLLALAGESYMQARDFNKAAEFFEKASVLAPQAASLRTSLGLSKLGQGDEEQAIVEMEKAIALDPKSQQAGIALVRTALGLKQFDKALAAVQKLEQQQPDNAIVQNLKGGVYLAKGDAANARSAFNKAVQLQPAYFPAVANLAQLDLTEKKPAETKKRLEAFVEKDKKHIGALTALAELANSQGRKAEATAWLEKASSENTDVAAPAIRLIAQYLRTGEKAKALTTARKFQTAHPANPELLDQLGQAQLANNDAAGALDTYSKLANVVPKSAAPHLRMAQVHAVLKNEPAMAEDIQRAIAIDPSNVQAQLARIDIAARKGQLDQALVLLRKLQQQNTNAAYTYSLEGDLLAMQKKPELALRAWEQAYRLGKSPQVVIKMAQLQRSSGKAAEADARVAQYMKEHPGEPLMAMHMAETHLANKQFKAAVALLEPLIKAQPNNVLALNNLAWAYQQDKDARALATAERAHKLAADNPGVLDTLAWILIEQGNTKRGLPLLEQALSRAPEANDIRYHLAYGLHKAGEKAKARKELETALASGKEFASMNEARALLKQM
ncbi:MAG: XrtA/PEP-CTERM system TPR-repeat protein PrsT [Pseudomonadota bacterium]